MTSTTVLHRGMSGSWFWGNSPQVAKKKATSSSVQRIAPMELDRSTFINCLWSSPGGYSGAWRVHVGITLLLDESDATEFLVVTCNVLGKAKYQKRSGCHDWSVVDRTDGRITRSLLARRLWTHPWGRNCPLRCCWNKVLIHEVPCTCAVSSKIVQKRDFARFFVCCS